MLETGIWAAAEVEGEPSKVIEDLREAVASGKEHWFTALLRAVGRWPLGSEEVGGRTYCYLIAGEAFDWLLLAERLCDELEDLLPEDEAEQLLFDGRMPLDLTDDEFRSHLGSAKYRAHLNYLYGIRVEEALQLAVQEEVFKERLSRIWENGHLDEEACRRIYGAGRLELLELFHGEEDDFPCMYLRREGSNGRNGFHPEREISLSELKDFTYWLFRFRMRWSDPARVASDTKKGLAQLERMELRKGWATTIGLR